MYWNGLLGFVGVFVWFGFVFFTVGKMKDTGLWGRNMN